MSQAVSPFPHLNEKSRQDGFGGKVKRLADFLVALLLLIVASPVLLLAALAIRVSMGAPVLFRQQRPGLREKIITIYKFRTMSEQRDGSGKLLPDEQRLTGLGKFVRALSIDELPQLWNVLTGDLSVVGPRPLLIEYIDRYSPAQRRRHLVRPGITGWAQVNGRNAISWEQKFEYDVHYVDHWTFWLDAKIFFITIWKVITREGISQEGQATMQKFAGSKTGPTDHEN
jgi:lipopolysaccharide/colanic/teichoic acid biosynthesis glycosyltransferase